MNANAPAWTPAARGPPPGFEESVTQGLQGLELQEEEAWDGGDGWEADAWGGADDPAAAGAEALAALAAEFPAYSPAALEGVLASTGGDARVARSVLAGIEAHATRAGDTARTAAAAPARRAPAPCPPPLAAFPALGGRGGGGGVAASTPPPSLPPPPPPAEEAFPALGAGPPPRRRPAEAPAPQPTAFAAAVRRNAGDAEAAAAAAGRAAAARAVPSLAAVGGALAGPGSPDAGPSWVSTGAAVAAEYASARAEAAALSRARNVCFEQATKAYLMGDKAGAKALAARGRQLADAMFAAHAAAADATLAARNPGRPGPAAAARPPTNLDLHGLHAAEGTAALARAVASMAAAGGGRLHVVVGAGKHTATTTARLPAAVRAWLVAEGVAFREPRPGGLDVFVRGA